jgi:hypothetical protein
VTAKARLAKLEDTLSPKAATLLWLAEAHQFPTLPAYVAWLVDQPAEAAPFWRVPEGAERAVRASMRGQPRDVVEAAAHQAVRDAVFLVELVLRLNVDAAELVRTETLRAVALAWEARALAAPGEPDVAAHGRGLKAPCWATWRDAIAKWTRSLDRAEQARHDLERLYLDGRNVLFPDQASACHALAELTERTTGGRRRVTVGTNDTPAAVIGSVRAAARFLLGGRASG